MSSRGVPPSRCGRVVAVAARVAVVGSVHVVAPTAECVEDLLRRVLLGLPCAAQKSEPSELLCTLLTEQAIKDRRADIPSTAVVRHLHKVQPSRHKTEFLQGLGRDLERRDTGIGCKKHVVSVHLDECDHARVVLWRGVAGIGECFVVQRSGTSFWAASPSCENIFDSAEAAIDFSESAISDIS